MWVNGRPLPSGNRFCGKGPERFAIFPPRRRVIATEVSKASVETAHHNLEVGCVFWI